MTMQSETTEPKIKLSWIGLILLLAFGGVWLIRSVGGPTTGSAAAQLEPAPIPGHPAPEISLVSTTGQRVKLSDFKGQPVLINFWATWCTPCRLEIPYLQAVYEDPGNELVILGVNATSQDGGDINGFIRELGMTYPVLLDTEGQASNAYQARGLPVSIFVDRNGIVHEVYRGLLTASYVREKRREL